METKIIYNDSQIVVCFKPKGVLSQQSDKGEENMVDYLKTLLECEIYPVHRLDKETCGIMVYAKTRSAAATITREIGERRFYKEYEALVHGNVEPKKGEMRDLLYRDRSKNKSFVVKRERKGVKTALLEYEVLEKRDYDGLPFSFVKIILHTGRTHQIRVQFSSRGYSLAGDRRYGGKDSFDTLQLSSVRLKFSHPITGEELDFKC